MASGVLAWVKPGSRDIRLFTGAASQPAKWMDSRQQHKSVSIQRNTMMQKPPPPDLRYATSVGILREHLVKKSNALRFFPFMLAGEIDACPLSGTGVSYGLFSLCTWYCFRLNERLFCAAFLQFLTRLTCAKLPAALLGSACFAPWKTEMLINVDYHPVMNERMLWTELILVPLDDNGVAARL